MKSAHVISALYPEVPQARTTGPNIWKLSRLPNMSRAILRPLQKNRTRSWPNPTHSAVRLWLHRLHLKGYALKQSITSTLPGWPLTLKSTRLCFPTAGIKDTWTPYLCFNARRNTDDVQSSWLHNIRYWLPEFTQFQIIPIMRHLNWEATPVSILPLAKAGQMHF